MIPPDAALLNLLARLEAERVDAVARAVAAEARVAELEAAAP